MTQKQLREILRYDPETGHFTYLVSRGPVRAGSRAGTVQRCGGGLYVRIQIDGYCYLAHRLAYFYMTDKWPTEMIDHWDLDGTNNCWSNLRPASRSQNGANGNAYRSNQLGIKGVFQKGNRFIASIKVNGKQRYLGSYGTSGEAADAFALASRRARGEFAKVS